MPADLALISGMVRTLDPSAPSASAVAIESGVVVAVGDNTEVADHCDSSTEVIDLARAAVVPGLIDSHMHPFLGAMATQGANLTGARTLAEVRRLVALERERRGPETWIQGFGLDYNVFEQTGIHGELLAEAAAGPALLMFNDLHTGLATPIALALAGVDGPRQFAQHAEVVCADGVPTGELREFGAVDLVRAAIPELTAAERYQLYAGQLREFAAVGITGVHAMDGSLETLELLRELEGNGDLAVRMITPFWVDPSMPREQWAAFGEQRDARGRRWRAGVAKFFIDGVIDAGTGWLFEPDSEGEGTEPFWPDPAVYREAVEFFATRGFQCVTHATGDRAVHEALDAYKLAGSAPGVSHRIEHIETIQPGDIRRFESEGVVASMQAQHMMDLHADLSDNWSRRLGPERCSRAFLVRTLWQSGAAVALGSDWPVARFDPREGIAAACLRRPPGVFDHQPYDDQALDRLTALGGYTSAAAAAVGDQGHLGALKVGAYADLTVLQEDPVRCDPDDLPANPVHLTVVDGEITYRSGV